MSEKQKQVTEQREQMRTRSQSAESTELDQGSSGKGASWRTRTAATEERTQA